MNKYLTNKMVDIWTTVIFTLGLAVIIFPIFIWLIYRYNKAKKEIKALEAALDNNPEIFKKVYATIGFTYRKFFQKEYNSVELHINDKVLIIPQGYIWFSKYKTKERLAEILNDCS